VAGALAGHLVEVDIRRLYLRNVALMGSSMHSPAHFYLLARAARRGALRPPVAASYPPGEIHDAQETLVRHEHVGKLVLIPGA
jgi:NADPH:quinone reductase-like Zn-dependent oxidoreductase